MLFEQYGLISNEGLADVLLNEQLGYGETMDEFAGRFEELDRVTSNDVAEFIRDNLPAVQFVEVQVQPR